MLGPSNLGSPGCNMLAAPYLRKAPSDRKNCHAAEFRP